MGEIYKEQLGAVIRRRRKALGLTQNELAELAHVKEPTTISRWERGERAPNNLDAVAAALQTTAAEMLAELRDVKQIDRRRLHPTGATQLDRIESRLNSLDALEEKVDQLLARTASDEVDALLGRLRELFEDAGEGDDELGGGETRRPG